MFDFLHESALLHALITVGTFVLFAISLGGMLLKKNLLKIFISLSIAETALFLFFIGMHFEVGKVAPIAADGVKSFDVKMVDPIPQAMILTTIVIAIAVLALALSFITNYFRLKGDMNISSMDELGEQR